MLTFLQICLVHLLLTTPYLVTIATNARQSFVKFVSQAQFRRRSFAASILSLYLSRLNYNKIDFNTNVAPFVLN